MAVGTPYEQRDVARLIHPSRSWLDTTAC